MLQAAVLGFRVAIVIISCVATLDAASKLSQLGQKLVSKFQKETKK